MERRCLVTWLLLLPGLFVGCAHAPTRAELTAAPRDGRTDVIVVGGGLAGLTAANALEQRGYSVRVLELADRWGGKVATAHYGPGLEAEYGMQEIWSKSPLAAIAREKGLPLDEGESPYSSVLLDGKLHAFSQDTDAQYFDALFSPEERQAQWAWMKRAESLWTQLHAKEQNLSPALQELQDLSFNSWLEAEKLPPRVAEWVRLTLECELGADADQFSALSGLAELRVFLFGGEQALHVKGGNSRLVEALAQSLRGEKTLRARVTHVTRHTDAQGRRTVRVDYLRDNQRHQAEASRVVVAVPWLMLHLIQMDPPLPAEVQDGLHTLGRGQYTVVHLLIDKTAHQLWGGAEKAPFPVLTRGPLGVIYGVAEPSPPAQTKEVFSLLVYGQHAKEFHLVPQETKRQELLAQLDGIWPGFSRHVSEVFIYPYHPAAIPYWPAGRSPFDERAHRLFQPVDGLYLAGDYLVSSHSEGAVIAGLRQAEAIAKDLGPKP